MEDNAAEESIGETTKESDDVSTFILKRADTVMETWQVSNALLRMARMIPKDKKRSRKLKQASRYVIASFVDALSAESLKEAADNRKRWDDELKSQDEKQRKERQLAEDRLQAQKDSESEKQRKKTVKVSTTSDMTIFIPSKLGPAQGG